ncbi:MAG: PaaI family thioesterase [Candidatus Marinimicrobia bacterium]|nr:PaaI family thioesterase [Candidatus Neomarinimicrobiota bacterium]
MPNEYTKCFACGIDNPIGLKLKFDYKDDFAIAKVKLDENYCGYPNIIHGGIVNTILDEAMAKIIIEKFGEAVTYEMTTTYKKPVSPETEYEVKSKIVSSRRRIIKSEATITDGAGELFAKAEATFFRVR